MSLSITISFTSCSFVVLTRWKIFPFVQTLGKVGQVRKVDHEGNLVVEVEGQVFRYSPACCLHEPESVTSHREETVRQEMTSMKIRSRITGNMENLLNTVFLFSLYTFLILSVCALYFVFVSVYFILSLFVYNSLVIRPVSV